MEAEAWKDIYGHHQGIGGYEKDKSQSFSPDKAHPSILDAPRDQHAKLRKLLSNSFSDKTLREQEPILNGYAMALVEKLKNQGSWASGYGEMVQCKQPSYSTRRRR